MQYLGDIAEDATLDFKFHTTKSAGPLITLAGTPAISVYKANGTAESTAGVTLTVDHDARTGCHHVRIDASAGVFYAVANDYQVVITAGTVDGVSVAGYVLANFSIENRLAKPGAVLDEAEADHQAAGSVGRALSIAAAPGRKKVFNQENATKEIYAADGATVLETLQVQTQAGSDGKIVEEVPQ